MSKSCVVCREPINKGSGKMCSNCLEAKYIIQRSVAGLMQLHGVPSASGMCVDCGKRPAEDRDHRFYARPLAVEFVCGPCNHARGHALDLFKLIKQHRKLVAIDTGAETVDLALPVDLVAHVQAYERRLVLEGLRRHKFNVTATARAFGIGHRTMRYKLEKLGLSDNAVLLTRKPKRKDRSRYLQNQSVTISTVGASGG